MGEGFKVQRQQFDPNIYLYKDGNEYVALTGGWGEGYKELTSGLTSSQTKESDNLAIVMERTSTGTGRRSWQTFNAIDLSNTSKLVFDWAGTHTDSYDDPGNIQYAIQVVTPAQAASNELTYTANYSKTFAFTREIAELNVSSLTGNYHIRFIMRVVNGRKIQGKLYSIKGVM